MIKTEIGIGNLIDIFEPEAICLGGSFSHYEVNPILDRLIDKLSEKDTTFTTSATLSSYTLTINPNGGTYNGSTNNTTLTQNY